MKNKTKMIQTFLLYGIIIFIVGCTQHTRDKAMDTIPDTLDKTQISGNDFRLRGTNRVSPSTGSLKSDSGCTVRYTLFSPEKVNNDILVVLGHGFFRSQKTQKKMAEHFASWGITTATVDFCNSRPWNGHHDKNGADMVKVTDELAYKKVIYAGFSAGGLAAFIAASLDDRTQAYLGLDMVDNFKKGQKATGGIKAPVYGLVAERSACNAKNNGLDVYRKLENKQILKLHGASHCDFEFPYDGKCSFVCGKSRKPYEREDIQKNILGLSTSILLEHVSKNASTKATANNWWQQDNQNFQLLQQSKRISLMAL